jgi:transcriptional regulator with PAS, ATPase and Fis domain
MAATSMELEKALGKEFRKDLYYRLSVVRIHIPPLRERREDIPALCTHLIQNLSGREAVITDSEMAQLMEYDWPGNVRELRNVLERAVFIQKGPLLQPSLLLEKTTMPEKPCSFPGTADTQIKTLDECEREIIGSALKQLAGNLTQTAKALGISLSTLKRKIKEFGMK